MYEVDPRAASTHMHAPQAGSSCFSTPCNPLSWQVMHKVKFKSELVNAIQYKKKKLRSLHQGINFFLFC